MTSYFRRSSTVTLSPCGVRLIPITHCLKRWDSKEVRELLHQFKAEKLSDVDPKDYEELYYSIEALDYDESN